MLFEPMNKLFPRLEDLSLLSTATEEDQEIGLVPPETFQAPDLHRLALHGIGLSTGSPLLTSAIALSTLSLTHIGASCYFPPGRLVKQLQGRPHLEELSIGFSIPIPLPSTEGDLLPPPIPPVTLAALRRLTFRGVDIYFDNLVAQVNTPVLERLSLTLFFDLTFTLVNLTEFIHRTEGFQCLVVKVIFTKDGAFIHAGHHEQRDTRTLSLNVICEPLDWQIDSAMQVCGALRNIVSIVEELTVDLKVASMPSGREDSVGRAPPAFHWGEEAAHWLLAYIRTPASPGITVIAGGLVLELLPGLEEVEVQLEFDHARILLSKFIETRESVGRPEHLLALPIPYELPPPLSPGYNRLVRASWSVGLTRN
jgi:hypothetical protein